MGDPGARLAQARLYLCSPPRPRDWLAAVCEAGVDVVQLRDRDKQMEAGPLCRAAEEFRAAADATGALFIVNDRPDVAVATGADGVHLGQDDLEIDVARRIVGPDVVIGRSTHDSAQAARAAKEDCDYFCVGPVWATPTKEGRPGVGLGLVEEVAQSQGDKPWFAIGGVNEANLGQVLEAGARRVVVVRVVTEASDPAAVARQLRARLV